MAVWKTNFGLVELARVRACETSGRPASWTGYSYVERIRERLGKRGGAGTSSGGGRLPRGTCTIGEPTIDGWPSGSRESGRQVDPSSTDRTWRWMARAVSLGASAWACRKTVTVLVSTTIVACARWRDRATHSRPGSVAKDGASR
jgi:hypothetical protein